MKLSKTSTQAALAVGYLASRCQDGPIQAKQVAGYLGVPTDSALKILQTLARRDVLQSRMGRGGGYSLSRSPEQTTLLEVIEAIEGPIACRMAIEPTDERHEQPLAVLAEVCQQSADHWREQLAHRTIASMQPIDNKNCAENGQTISMFTNRFSSVA